MVKTTLNRWVFRIAFNFPREIAFLLSASNLFHEGDCDTKCTITIWFEQRHKSRWPDFSARLSNGHGSYRYSSAICNWQVDTFLNNDQWTFKLHSLSTHWYWSSHWHSCHQPTRVILNAILLHGNPKKTCIDCDN